MYGDDTEAWLLVSWSVLLYRLLDRPGVRQVTAGTASCGLLTTTAPEEVVAPTMWSNVVLPAIVRI